MFFVIDLFQTYQCTRHGIHGGMAMYGVLLHLKTRPDKQHTCRLKYRPGHGQRRTQVVAWGFVGWCRRQQQHRVQ